MKIFAYEAAGFAGSLVAVDVDIRRGMPGLDIVGLPDGAVRESRDRVRVALKRSGFEFPSQRILVSLSPAGLRKEGAAYDLPVAVGILSASGQLDTLENGAVLCAGELRLDGSLRPVRGVLPAAAASMAAGIDRFIVPEENLVEAAAIPGGRPMGLGHLKKLPALLLKSWPDAAAGVEVRGGGEAFRRPRQEMSDIRGQGVLKRAVETAAAGGHHLMIFGPPGSGKTMAARAMAGLLPDLDSGASLEVTRIWSQAGKLGSDDGLIRRPPFREPHHTASAEGLVGGRGMRPGEASLAHGGILFLDEAPEFSPRVLQSLREPLEAGRVDMARADRTWWYPADFQLIMAMNPCPCGNLGREESPCICTPPEISRHWRKLGGALLDRVDIRVPVSPVPAERLLEPPGEGTAAVRSRVEAARKRQADRYSGTGWTKNADVPPGALGKYIGLDRESAGYFNQAVRKLGLSSRAAHGVLRVSQTLADLAGRDRVRAEDVLEGLQHRRYGDRDLFWTTL